MRFYDGCENYPTSDELTVMKVDRIPVDKEAKPTISMKPEEEVYFVEGILS